MVADELFSVIAEPTRRDILGALAGEQKAVGQLVDELGVSQPTISKHLRVLREAGVVNIRAQGQKRYYSINAEPLGEVAQWLSSIGVTATAPSSKSAQEKEARPSATAPAAQVAHQALAEKTMDAARTALDSSVVARAASVDARYLSKSSSGSSVSKNRSLNGLSPVQTNRPAGQSDAEVAASHDGGESKVQQQITRSVGRAANKAADLLSSLPAFRRRKD